MNFVSTQKIPPLNKKKLRLLSARTASRTVTKVKFFISSNDQPKYQTQKIKLMNTNRITMDIAECCGSPVSWLKKSKPALTKQTSNEIHNKFNNLCLKNSDIIDEVIVTNSNEIQKSNNNSQSFGHSSKSLDKKQSSLLLFKTLSKKLDLDQFLNKTISTTNGFTFIPGDIIAESPQSTIYKCLNVTTGEIIVAKTFTNPSLRKKYEDEVSMLSLLSSHENILQYKSTEIINNIPFIFTEYLSGGSIKKLIDIYGKLPEDLIKKYTLQILHGLQHIHSKHIIHCDLKCANILLDGSTGVVKIADFGSASKTHSHLSSMGVLGTLPWCAPEVICGLECDEKCDVWSLGCTVLEMVTGLIPWSEKKIDNYYQCVNVIGKGKDTPVIPDYVSDKMRKFIEKCLVRDVDKRATVEELLKDEFIITG